MQREYKDMKYKILFICLGNICRSSAAEEVMRSKIASAGLSSSVEVDSAGLIDYHEGEKSDPRMLRHAYNRGYKITHRSRPIQQEDFAYFDLIIGMDHSNISRLKRMATSAKSMAKIHLMTEYAIKSVGDVVPDPYYGGDAGFELVLDLLEDTCEGLLNEIRRLLNT